MRPPRDHPRVCGEKTTTRSIHSRGTGSPPRVRGKAKCGRILESKHRITPAYAGKSHRLQGRRGYRWDHPRACREKPRSSHSSPRRVGSPPHVRGKGKRGPALFLCIGITPACAGKSTASRQPAYARRDHPRVCGEKLGKISAPNIGQGSPPHVRGKERHGDHRHHCHGITPAYAGKSHPACPERSRTVDHPRVCGEKNQNLEWADSVLGSPPRVRGKADHTRHLVHLSFLRA